MDFQNEPEGIQLHDGVNTENDQRATGCWPLYSLTQIILYELESHQWKAIRVVKGLFSYPKQYSLEF